jgi:acyl-coenzyme A synthetase/AMP-(fatty) acid ligase
VCSGSNVRYADVEPHSRHVASWLTRVAEFKRGDVLYSSVYECSHVYVAMLAAWRLGGVTRNCYYGENTGTYRRI